MQMIKVMKLNKFIIITLILSTVLFAVEGKEVYEKKCKSCHILYISITKLQENFLQENNKLLNLKAPTINQITFRLKTRIGDPKGDKDIHKMEVDAFVTDYLKKPNKQKSICLPDVIKHFDTMPIIKLNDEEQEAINEFLYDYDKNDYIEKTTNYFELKNAFDIAKKENKIVMTKFTSEHCYYCKKMDREVMVDSDVVLAIEKNFIPVEIDTIKDKLPFGLKEVMTPTFLFISPNKKVLKKVPGSWNKVDFIDILKETVQGVKE
jgi:thioredoxin-related protein